MPEISYPLAGDEFTDTTWRNLFVDQTGIVGDYDGSSYRLTLPTTGDLAALGSTTQDSLAKVAGFGHRIARNDTATIEVPPVLAAGSVRTDVIALRYDPSYSGAPGPVRLVVVTGTVGTVATMPVLDRAAPGIEDLPLYAVTRRYNTTLSQSTVQSLRQWTGESLYLGTGNPLPTSAPLGSLLTLGLAQYQRVLPGTTPTWQPLPGNLTGTSTARPSGIGLPVGSTVYETDTRLTRTWDGAGWQDPGLTLFGVGGSLVGTPTAANTRFLVQSGTQVATSDGSGVTPLVFPKPFPGGLLTVLLTNGDDNAANDTSFNIAGSPYASEVGRVHYRAWGPSGATAYTRIPLLRHTHRVNYVAIGW